jgi:hypothetical protein
MPLGRRFVAGYVGDPLKAFVATAGNAVPGPARVRRPMSEIALTWTTTTLPRPAVGQRSLECGSRIILQEADCSKCLDIKARTNYK